MPSLAPLQFSSSPPGRYHQYLRVLSCACHLPQPRLSSSFQSPFIKVLNPCRMPHHHRCRASGTELPLRERPNPASGSTPRSSELASSSQRAMTNCTTSPFPTTIVDIVVFLILVPKRPSCVSTCFMWPRARRKHSGATGPPVHPLVLKLV